MTSMRVDPSKLFSRGLILTFLLVLTATLGSRVPSTFETGAAQLTSGSLRRLGLQIQSRVILDSLPFPSFEELRRIGVSDIGTNVGSDFTSNWWRTLMEWNEKAHKYGFRTYAHINDLDQVEALAATAVGNGFDTVELDEMISNRGMTEEQFVKIVSAARRVKAETEFIITEWNRNAIERAFQWAARVPGVRVASSDYDDPTTLDYVRMLQQTHGVKAIAWLIFIPDPEHDWNCSKEIREWGGRAKVLGLDLFFWSINADETWMMRWEIVRSLLAA